MEDDNEQDQLNQTQRLKAAVHYTVGKICQEVGEEEDIAVTFNRQFIAVLSEATFKYTETIARDTELFARHAKRSTVNSDDIKLLVRKSPELLNHISELSNQQAVANEEKKKNKKGKKKATSTTHVNEEDNENP